jgi:hypothetical protein
MKSHRRRPAAAVAGAPGALDVAAGALAAMTLVAGAVVAGCARDRTGATVVRQGLLGALPRESVALLVIEVRALGRARASSSWMRELAAAADEGPFREIRDRFGTEAFGAVDRIGLAVVPRPDNKVAYGVVAEGSFDRRGMVGALGGEDLLTVQEAAEERPDLSLAVLPAGDLAVGPRAVLETVRANAARRGDGLDANDVLLGLLERVRPSSQIWGAIDCRRLNDLARQFALVRGVQALPLDPGRPIGSLTSLAFEGRGGRSLEFVVLAEAGDEKGARDVADAVRSLLAIARLGAGQEAGRDWVELLDAITVAQAGPSLTVRGSIPEKTMAALAARARAAAGAGTPP